MKVSNLPYGLISQMVRQRGLEGLLEWVEFCAANGLDGVEIAEVWLGQINWTDVLELIEGIRRWGLEVSALNAFNARVNCPPGDAREQAVVEMARYLRMAQALRTGLLIIGSGNWGDFECYRMTRGQAVDNTVATIERCLPLAERAGVTLCIENHPGWLTRYADVLAGMLRRLPSERLALNLDTGSLYREGQRPADFLKHEIVARKTRYVHLKTIRFEDDPETGRWNQDVPFEQSHVDYDAIFSALKKAGFDGWVSYEASAGVGLEGLPRGAQFARGMLAGQ